MRDIARTTIRTWGARMVLGALGLTVAVAAPASGAPGGTDRPLKGTGSGVNVLTFGTGPATATFVGEEIATVSHLGRSAIHVEGTSVLPATGQPVIAGEATLVAADGDELRSSFTGRGVVGDQDGTLVITATVSGPVHGGTGRFGDARGTITDHLVLRFTDASPPVLTASVTSSLRGTISY